MCWSDGGDAGGDAGGAVRPVWVEVERRRWGGLRGGCVCVGTSCHTPAINICLFLNCNTSLTLTAHSLSCTDIIMSGSFKRLLSNLIFTKINHQLFGPADVEQQVVLCAPHQNANCWLPHDMNSYRCLSSSPNVVNRKLTFVLSRIDTWIVAVSDTRGDSLSISSFRASQPQHRC